MRTGNGTAWHGAAGAGGASGLSRATRRALLRLKVWLSGLSWPAILTVVAVHAGVTAAGLILVDERDLVSGPFRFLYFYVVTGSSVGYGDFSPATRAGQLFAAAWVIPGAIGLFTLLLGKGIAAITERITAVGKGFGDFADHRGHTVVLGHVEGRTAALIEEVGASAGEVVIVSTADLQGRPEARRWLRADSLSDVAVLRRAGVAGARHVVAMTGDDATTVAACLAVRAAGSDAHLVAYFRSEAQADLIEATCPGVETVSSTAVAQMGRAIVDPGASDVMRVLASRRVGATLFSGLVAGATTCARLSAWLLAAHGASLVGVRSGDAGDADLALDADRAVPDGARVFYIARARIAEPLAVEGEAGP